MKTLIILLLIICVAAATEELRCKKPKYHNCTMIYTNMSMWCDHTNLTSIPKPENLVGTFHAEADKSSILIFAQSCVKTIDKNALLRYQWLIFLDLSGNFIEFLQVSNFKDDTKRLKKLKKLYLSRNLVNRIDDEAFKGLTNLQDLHLDGNQINVVTKSTFNDLTSLQVLKLSNNKLEYLPKDVFRCMDKLRVLDLSGNKLTMFKPVYLIGLSDLVTLNLSSNALQSFDAPHVFLAGSNIKELYLNNNSITCFPENAFDKNDLTVIQIADNPLQRPNQHWFAQFVRENTPAEVQHSILLSKSGSWVCDCNVYSYHKFLKTLTDDWLKKLDIRCSEPVALRGRSLSEVTWPELSLHGNCTTPDQVYPCPHVEHPTFRTPTTSTSTTTTTIVTTTTPTITSTKEVETVANVISSGHRPKSEMSQAPTKDPVSSTNIVIYIVLGSVGLLLIVFIFISLVFLKRRSQSSSEKSNDRKTTATAIAYQEGKRKRRLTENSSREDSIEEIQKSSESLIPLQMERPSTTGRSESNLQIENEFLQQDSNETRVKGLLGDYQAPSVIGSTQSSHVYESLHNSQACGSPGNSQNTQQSGSQTSPETRPKEDYLTPQQVIPQHSEQRQPHASVQSHVQTPQNSQQPQQQQQQQPSTQSRIYHQQSQLNPQQRHPQHPHGSFIGSPMVGSSFAYPISVSQPSYQVLVPMQVSPGYQQLYSPPTLQPVYGQTEQVEMLDECMNVS